MTRSMRLGAAAAGVLIGLFALHVQLNLGGWPRFLHRVHSGGPARGDLVVGFLPVT